MWIFGHLGIGSKIAQPLGRRLPYGWILTGTLLPDLIDKPLYYGFVYATGRWSDEIGLISCSRTFGHSGLFLLALLIGATYKKSKWMAALALGVATHFALDNLQDQWSIAHGAPLPSSALLALLYPLSGKFGEMLAHNPTEHMKNGAQPVILITEMVGLLILLWDDWKSKKLRALRIPRLWRKSKVGR